MNTAFKTMSELAELSRDLNEIYYNNMCEGGALEQEPLQIIREILETLRHMDDYLIDITGSYYKHEPGNYKLFYIDNMGLLYVLLKQGKYIDFLHELADFILYNILEDGDNPTDYLPANIKHAIIKTIELGLKE